ARALRSAAAELDREVGIAAARGRLGAGGSVVVALRAAVAGDLAAQRELMIDPRSLDVGIDAVIAQRLAQDLEAALELAAEDRVPGVRGAHRPAGVRDARRAEQRRGQLVLAVDQVLAIHAAEHEADHHVVEHAAVEVGEHCAQALGTDVVDQRTSHVDQRSRPHTGTMGQARRGARKRTGLRRPRGCYGTAMASLSSSHLVCFGRAARLASMAMVVSLAACGGSSSAPLPPAECTGDGAGAWVSDSRLCVSEFASGLGGARQMAFAPNGDLFVNNGAVMV